MSADEPWYVRAFRAEYLEVYPHRDAAAARAEVRWLVEQGVRGRVLDLACGAGRHSAALAEAGQEVLGLDLSEDLLRAARGAEYGPRIAGRLVRADARALPCAAAAFDAVVMLFSSFGYLGPDGDTLVVREIARVLRPGGVCVLDLMNPAQVRAGLVPHSTRERAGLKVDERRRLEESGRFVVKDVTLTHASGELRRWTERVRLYEEAEVRSLLDHAGLRVGAVHGDFGPLPAAPGAPRLIVVARKL